ncbi:M1 family metallopeptidase [Spirulina sp. 06S082]|uniref:M1 family metallopeptidase n=1 Tax=Spirulina sp. 06S082 TaxID=3110248 RepID=UPI002B20936C|nr:M1 family metallopeptidase [Spirulina sp. 06S082]MEA5470645.1 M1 family metallopeptidase [Spirulina sp. 06S082]
MPYFYFDSEENDRKSFELPGAKPHYNPDRPGQVEHIFLDLAVDISQKCVIGICTITLKPIHAGIRSLTLDAIDLKIESVKIGEIFQPFDYDGEELQIELVEPTRENAIQIAIAYRLQDPQRGLYFIVPEARSPQVWTQGEDEDSRYWFPCFDYPGQLASSEIRVRVPQPFLAISNGDLIATEREGEETIYHWYQKQIHPSYLITLAVGDFAEIKAEWNSIPITYYVEKGREEDGKRSMGKTPRMMEFLSQKYGYTYPFSKYAQVCVADFIFGGMENTSTTLLTDRCLLDERAALDNDRTESLVVHELAHQWFGDLVVIKHWSHAWIKEGAASYSEVQWVEHEYGQDEGAYYLLKEARSYLSEDKSRYRRPIVTNIYREAIELYDRHLYEKGACVYHMIRGILGDELFDRAIQTFLRDRAHQSVETIDLLRAIEKSTGRNLAFLFDSYVFRGGHPAFKVSYGWDRENNLAKVTVKQTQTKNDSMGSDRRLFDLKIPIAFGYVDSQEKVSQQQMTVQVNLLEQTYYFPLPKKPQFFSFDVGNYFLKTVSLEYPVAELKAQLQYDPDPVSRIYAAIALAKKGNLDTVKALEKALKSDAFWGVRVEVAKQLAKVKLTQAEDALRSGLSDSDARVRRTIIESLSQFKTEESYREIQQIAANGDASYYTEATALRKLGSMVSGVLKEKKESVLDLLQQVLKTRSGWNEVVRSGAIAGLSQMKTAPEAAEIIAEYTKPGTPQALRLAAIRALGAVSVGQTPDRLEAIAEQLEALAGESFFLTQVAVTNALGQMQTSAAIGILTSLAGQTLDGRVRRMAEEAVKKVQKNLGSDKAVKQLRDEFETLKKENQELKSRLAKLEAK